MAPEVIKEGRQGVGSDVWAAGMTLVEMSSGKPPYHEYDGIWQVMFQISEGLL